MDTKRPSLLLFVVLFAFVLFFLEVSQAFAMAAATTQGNVAVVGCGVLGTSLCKQLLKSPAFANSQITGITKTTNRYEEIQSQVVGSDGGVDDDRFHLTTMENVLKQKSTFPNVVFCAPPSGFEDYPKAIQECIEKLWDNNSNDGGGTFVFTSSGGIYGGGSTTSVEVVTETSPVADPSTAPRIERLIQAEQIVREQNGGYVLRLAGLYTATRGAHGYWFGSGNPIRGRPDGIINLLHYDDAAGACLAALLSAKPTDDEGKKEGTTFLVSDGNPLSRKEICESAMKSTLFKDKTMPEFEQGGEQQGPMGKIYDGSATNAALNWSPRYESFDSFMKDQ